jgi:hypothetical protein
MVIWFWDRFHRLPNVKYSPTPLLRPTTHYPKHSRAMNSRIWTFVLHMDSDILVSEHERHVEECALYCVHTVFSCVARLIYTRSNIEIWKSRCIFHCN